MAKSSADDAQLRRVCEAAMAGTKQEILLSIKVSKSRGIWGKSVNSGRGHVAKPRVLALATETKGRRTTAFLRVLKYSNGGVLIPAKLYNLKYLSKVEVAASDPTGCTFMLVFDNLRSHSVAPPQWTMRNVDDSNSFLFCIFNTCKGMLGHLPKVVGIDVVEMALWVQVHGDTIQFVSSFMYDLLARIVSRPVSPPLAGRTRRLAPDTRPSAYQSSHFGCFRPSRLLNLPTDRSHTHISKRHPSYSPRLAVSPLQLLLDRSGPQHRAPSASSLPL